MSYLKCKLEWLTGAKDAQRSFRVKFNGWVSPPLYRNGETVMSPPLTRSLGSNAPYWLLIEQEGRVDEYPQGPIKEALATTDSVTFTLNLP